MDTYLHSYFTAAAGRLSAGIYPLPLSAAETAELCGLLTAPDLAVCDEAPEIPDPQKDPKAYLAFLCLPQKAGLKAVQLRHFLCARVSPGVSDPAKVKASFLEAVARGKQSCPVVSPEDAVAILGQMGGGFCVNALTGLLADPALGERARAALSQMVLIHDGFEAVADLARGGCAAASGLMADWAAGLWLTTRPQPALHRDLTVMRVSGEINTDDLSPGPDAWSRPDIPLHALSMLKMPRPGITPDLPGTRGPVTALEILKRAGRPILFAGDVVGTGSSRKSAANSLLWHIGEDLPGVPNKRGGGVVAGGKIAPIFFNTLSDAGALVLECDVSALNDAQAVTLDLSAGVIKGANGATLTNFVPPDSETLACLRAGGRINLILGRDLTRRARKFLGICAPLPEVLGEAKQPEGHGGFTRAQKIVGRACGLAGVRPGQNVQPQVNTVGSQDTTGPMTRDELTDLACVRFACPLVMQSFCHTAAYPRQVDAAMHRSLPEFIRSRGGVALRPGDGVIHSWLNRMCLPDTVGTGGDSHTRMPLGISFPAGSGLVAFAATTGTMPLTMPESVLVRFTGTAPAGITMRDLVHAIPLTALKAGSLTLSKEGKRNVFSGRILEIEGLEDLSADQAFEFADASAERSAAACAVNLSRASVERFLKTNIRVLKALAEGGYESREALLQRAAAMEEWIEHGDLLAADPDCTYAAELTVERSEVREPLLCAPNDPDDVRLLSTVAGTAVQEVFIGSCMTNLGQLKAAALILGETQEQVPVRLWIAPPTRLDREALAAGGYLAAFGRAGARLEVPGCSLCMGNQARVAPKACVLSTSTRNFPNRLGDGAQVFLASAELCAVTALLGRIPTAAEYMQHTACLAGHPGLYAPLEPEL